MSDGLDTVLELQGFDLPTLKAFYTGTISLAIDHFKDREGLEHLDVDVSGSGDVQRNREEHVLDWNAHTIRNPVYGPIKSKSRRIKLLSMRGLKLCKMIRQSDGWAADAVENGVIEVHTECVGPDSRKSWTCDEVSENRRHNFQLRVLVWLNDHQIWGITDIGGERRFVRHSRFTCPMANPVFTRMTYDYGTPRVDIFSDASLLNFAIRRSLCKVFIGPRRTHHTQQKYTSINTVSHL